MVKVDADENIIPHAPLFEIVFPIIGGEEESNQMPPKRLLVILLLQIVDDEPSQLIPTTLPEISLPEIKPPVVPEIKPPVVYHEQIPYSLLLIVLLIIVGEQPSK